MLTSGTKAPDFCLPDQKGELHRLSDFAGKKVIIYFYSKDGSLGCTKQAKGFAELYPEFREKGVAVIGVSKDSPAAHQRFAEKWGLSFTLLSDESKETLQAYDVWKAKTDHGKTVFATVRTTYLIDEQGVIVWASDKVKAADNPRQMLDLLAQL